MENASKALLMAGGVLIAIIILSIGVFLFSTYSNVGTKYETTLESSEKIKFNSNFTKYIGRDNISAQEIVSVINFAKDYEKKNQIHIDVFAPGLEEDLINFIKEKSDIKFTLLESNITYDQNGIVNSIRFTK